MEFSFSFQQTIPKRTTTSEYAHRSGKTLPPHQKLKHLDQTAPNTSKIFYLGSPYQDILEGNVDSLVGWLFRILHPYNENNLAERKERPEDSMEFLCFHSSTDNWRSMRGQQDLSLTSLLLCIVK